MLMAIHTQACLVTLQQKALAVMDSLGLLKYHRVVGLDE